MIVACRAKTCSRMLEVGLALVLGVGWMGLLFFIICIFKVTFILLDHGTNEIFGIYFEKQLVSSLFLSFKFILGQN